MNPNDSNPNLNQVGTSSNGGPFVTQEPTSFGVPQMPASQGVQSVNNVTPTPMPAQGTPVTPVQMPAQGVPVTPTPVAPTPVSNTVVNNPNMEDPNAKLTEVKIPPSASNNVEEPQVINTTKKKASNILLFIIIIILVVFAVNIDKISEMYDNYMKTGSLTASNADPDNTTTSGYIKIDDTSSSKKINNINFYNFRKSTTDLSIGFNYESSVKIDDSASLGIYVELYNSNKEILYKELFKVNDTIEMNSVSNYTMTLESDIHTNAYYALVKQYTISELNTKTTLTCKYNENDYQYENVYYFTNNSLVSYDVTKVSLLDEDTSLEKEYNELKDKVNPSLNNKTLKYSVDLEKDNIIEPIYPKGLTPVIVKSRDTLKKWTCE